VQGEKNEGVSIDTLKVVLLNLIGITVNEREREFEIETREGDEEGQHSID